MKSLRDAWSAATSADPQNWTKDNPAYGQCAVTALVIQDLMGGDLMRGVVNGVSHYWNRLADGQEIDATREQFPEINTKEAPVVRTREYVLSSPDTARRYARLKDALGTEQ